jgi:hypothetical protein
LKPHNGASFLLETDLGWMPLDLALPATVVYKSFCKLTLLIALPWL